jgi:hypothetical protein
MAEMSVALIENAPAIHAIASSPAFLRLDISDQGYRQASVVADRKE